MGTEEVQETQLTREELYDLVWSEPMQALGPRFGLSDVGFKKICKKLRVPTPGRGYWAQKAAGIAPRRTPLPKLPTSVSASQQVAIFGRPVRPARTVTAEAVGPVADQERYEAEHRITVPETLTDPHKLVAASVHLLRQAKMDGQHRLIPRGKKCLALSVTLGTADRAMLVYDTLIKACEAREFAVTVTESEQGSETTVTMTGERVSIAIEERVDRVERKPDPKAKPLYSVKEYDYVPSGRLAVRLQHPYLGARQSWSDGAKQRVESCLNDVLVGLVAAAEALKAQRLLREAQQREFEAAEERRRLAEKRREEEAARIRALDASLTAWRKSLILREYAASMRQAAETAGLLGDRSPMSAWLDWVDAYADHIDPTMPVPAVPADPNPHAWSRYGPGSGTPDPRPLW